VKKGEDRKGKKAMNVQDPLKFEESAYPSSNGGTPSEHTSKGFSGEIHCRDIHEIINSISLSKFDVALMVRNGPKDGKIIFKGGEILASICGKLRGRKALSEIKSWTEGYFTLYRIFDGILCREE
jgi:hypothetical protein